MSVYNTLDEGIASEIRVDDVSPRRRTLGVDAQSLRARSHGERHIARRASPANEPFPATLKWAAGLPRDVCPKALLREFPRVANRLANAWNDSTAFRAYVFDLLIDRRGGRRGFPADVEAELLTLRAFFDDYQRPAGSAPIRQVENDPPRGT